MAHFVTINDKVFNLEQIAYVMRHTDGADVFMAGMDRFKPFLLNKDEANELNECLENYVRNYEPEPRIRY